MPLNPAVSLTYSPAFTLVPTNECFNRCAYCNFRRDADQATWLSLDQAQVRLHQLQGSGICEILILSGEVHPQSARRSQWFEHIYQLCQMVLDAGFLPHSNVGPLSYREMERLGQVNVSMGLMLEQHQSDLEVHSQAPSKDPQVRLQQLSWAGELQIPFTTGLLLGIGETSADWQVSLKAIAAVHQRWGHIQEVILQPYQPGSQEQQPQLGVSSGDLVEVVRLARSILPAAIAIQIPPNLVQIPILQACIEAGVTDLGGLVPHDYVNPDYDHLPFAALKAQLSAWGYALQPRLPVYASLQDRLSQPLQGYLAPWLNENKAIGFARAL